MKKHRKTISQWENTLLRRTALIALLVVAPIWVLLQILWSLVMNGVPETWDAIKGLFDPNGYTAIREAWMGRENFRKWRSEKYQMNVPAMARADQLPNTESNED